MGYILLLRMAFDYHEVLNGDLPVGSVLGVEPAPAVCAFSARRLSQVVEGGFLDIPPGSREVLLLPGGAGWGFLPRRLADSGIMLISTHCYVCMTPNAFKKRVYF